MKKQIITLFAILICALSYSQNYIMLNAPAETAGNFAVTTSARIGSIQIITNSAFDGTTGTVVLEGSNDGTNWIGVFKDDDVTPLSFTLAAGENNYAWIFKTIAFFQYRIVYTVGDATTGTVNAILIQK